METRAFWRNHLVLPAVLLAAAFATIRLADLDLRLADAIYGVESHRSWPGAGSWWAVDLVHAGGGWLVRVAGLAAIVAWVLCSRVPRWRGWHAAWAYVVVAMIASTAAVAGLKLATNMDCPRDLAPYGGTRPHVRLLGDRPDGLPRAACWPGSHATSGFALMAFYFALRDRRPGLARVALGAALALGTAFSIGQQARGAHFLSHDLAGGAIAWFILLGLYRWLPGTGLQWSGQDRATAGGRA